MQVTSESILSDALPRMPCVAARNLSRSPTGKIAMPLFGLIMNSAAPLVAVKPTLANDRSGVLTIAPILTSAGASSGVDAISARTSPHACSIIVSARGEAITPNIASAGASFHNAS
jgi:hypothetical protein